MLDYQRKRCKGKLIKIPRHLRGELVLALLGAIVKSGCRVLVIAATQKHAHLLVGLPKRRSVLKLVVGTWKSARTAALRREMRGSIWGEGGSTRR